MFKKSGFGVIRQKGLMEIIAILLIFLGHIWVDASQGILPVVLVKLKELFALTYF